MSLYDMLYKADKRVYEKLSLAHIPTASCAVGGVALVGVGTFFERYGVIATGAAITFSSVFLEMYKKRTAQQRSRLLQSQHAEIPYKRTPSTPVSVPPIEQQLSDKQRKSLCDRVNSMY